jgi:hypothetical protein
MYRPGSAAQPLLPIMGNIVPLLVIQDPIRTPIRTRSALLRQSVTLSGIIHLLPLPQDHSPAFGASHILAVRRTTSVDLVMGIFHESYTRSNATWAT